MLLNGEIDAAVALLGMDAATIRPVIPDADIAAANWFGKTGAYPVNHIVCVRTDLVRNDPALGAELFRMFNQSKAASSEASAEARYTDIVGSDPLPYGLEENRKGIELCLRYAAEQGLVPRVYAPEELFLPV